ncbi:hypothetical protein GW17_00000724, partial [Ensete ventricosum]
GGETLLFLLGLALLLSRFLLFHALSLFDLPLVTVPGMEFPMNHYPAAEKRPVARDRRTTAVRWFKEWCARGPPVPQEVVATGGKCFLLKWVTGTSPLPCILQKFLDSSKLKRHYLIHTGERDFICPYEGCGKVIILSSISLNVYLTLQNTMVDMVKHATPVEKPHTSKATAAAYGSASAERPYACPYEGCEKAYIHEYKLNLHLRKEHPGHNSEENGKPAPVVGHGLEEASDQEVYITKGGIGKNSKRSKPNVAPQMPPAKITNRKGNLVPTNMPAVKKQWASKEMYEEDSEETEEEDRENAEEEDGWRYRVNGDDEETEDEE